eukprot:2202036-Rhodomonas_salina.1
MRPRTWLTDRPVTTTLSELSGERSMTMSDEIDSAALGIESLPEAGEPVHETAASASKPKQDVIAEPESEPEPQSTTQEVVPGPAEAPESVEEEQDETQDLPQSESGSVPGSAKWVDEILEVAQMEATWIEVPGSPEPEAPTAPEQSVPTSFSAETNVEEGGEGNEETESSEGVVRTGSGGAQNEEGGDGDGDTADAGEVVHAEPVDEKSGTEVAESMGERKGPAPAGEEADSASTRMAEAAAGSSEQGFSEVGLQRVNSERIWPSTVSGTTDAVKVSALERANSEIIWPTTSSGQTADTDANEDGAGAEDAAAASGEGVARVDSGMPAEYVEDWEAGGDEEEIAEQVSSAQTPGASAPHSSGHGVPVVGDRSDVHRRYSTVVENSFEVLGDDDEATEALAEDLDAAEVVEQEQIQGEDERRSPGPDAAVLDQGTAEPCEGAAETVGQDANASVVSGGTDGETASLTLDTSAVEAQGDDAEETDAGAVPRSEEATPGPAMADAQQSDAEAAAAAQPQTVWKKAPWLSFKQLKPEPAQDSHSEQVQPGTEERLEEHFGLDGQPSVQTSDDGDEAPPAQDPPTSQPTSALEDEDDAS